jgi:HlyD family secretion protein
MWANKKLRYTLIALGLILIIAVVGKKAGLFGNTDAIEVAVEKAQKRTIYEVITANGKIQPVTEVKLSADVSGEIIDIFIKEGDAVKEGQLLMKIKPDIYASMLDRAQAAVNTSKSDLENWIARQAQAEAKYKQASLSYNRNKLLWEQKAISQAEWDAVTAEFEIAKADLDASKQNVKSAQFNVKSAEASYKEAGEKMRKTNVYAPMNGIVTKLIVEKGERVAGTDMMAGSEMMVIADLSKMEAQVDVNENDIVRVGVGDTAIIDVDAYLDIKFRGVVAEIANSANSSAQATTDQVTSFEVKINVLPESYKMLVNKGVQYPFRPGMSASVEIQTECKTNALSIPIQAVTSRTDSSLKVLGKSKSVKTEEASKESIEANEVVFLCKKSIARSKKVVTGIQDNNYIEVKEGIKEGDEIVIAPYSAISRRLKDSVMVKVVDKNELFKEK